MRPFAGSLIVPWLALPAACLHSPSPVEPPGLVDTGALPSAPAAAAPPHIAADDAAVAAEARLDVIVRLARARNPELLVEEERVQERAERVSIASRLPDLELKYEQWGVPLARPYALHRADALMIGVRQTFPALGSRGAQERAAREQVEVARHQLHAGELDVIRQVERAYYEYVLAGREQAIHVEHAELAQRILDLTRASFRTGGAGEQDVLRVGVELRTLHRDLAVIDQRRRSATALLNALMGRAATAPLGPPPDPEATEIRAGIDELERLSTVRPEVRAAQHGVRSSQAGIDAARSVATWPSVMVGVDYMFMPEAEHERHGYGAMVSINLPWLNPRYRDEVRVAERAAAAEQRALASIERTVGYQVHDAFARYRAARITYLITRDELLPAARQSFEAAQAGLAAGRGTLALLDAMQTLLQVRLDEVRERIELRAAIADLERAVAVDLDEIPLAAPGAQP